MHKMVGRKASITKKMKEASKREKQTKSKLKEGNKIKA